MKKYILACVIITSFFPVYSMQLKDPKDLLEAASNLDVEKVKQLVNSNEYDLEAKDSLGRTVLFLAIKPRFYDSRYALPNEKTNQVEIIKFLVAKNARTDVIDRTGKTMYFYAQQSNWWHVLQALPKEQKQSSYIYYASQGTSCYTQSNNDEKGGTDAGFSDDDDLYY